MNFMERMLGDIKWAKLKLIRILMFKLSLGFTMIQFYQHNFQKKIGGPRSFFAKICTEAFFYVLHRILPKFSYQIYQIIPISIA